MTFFEKDSLEPWMMSLDDIALWVGYAFLFFLVVASVQFIRLLFSDADLGTLAAARSMPRGAFNNKVVWIVGASSGIGASLAYALARHGATLILSARRVDMLDVVQKKCLSLGSPNVKILPIDVCQFQSHASAAKEVISQFSRIDYLVNNAGRSQRALAEETNLSVDQEMFNLNLFGVLSVTKAVLPFLLQQKHGMIVNTSSLAGKMGSPISSTYSSTKFAIQGFFDALRMEVSDRGVRVLNVCPGPVESEITLHAFKADGGSVGELKEKGTKRISSERCAELMIAAMYAQLEEIWIAPQPILIFAYIAQYCRSAYFWLGSRVGPKRVAAFRSGVSGYGSLYSFGKTASTNLEKDDKSE